MENASLSFVEQTAKDFDLSIEIVEAIWEKSFDADDFYCNLENEKGE